MGGSSGSGVPLNQRNLSRLEDVARSALKDGAQPTKRNVFISFASEDLGDVNLLRGQAKNENSDLDFNDRSLKEPFNSENEEYIKRGIRERIRQSSVTIIYVSDNTAQSEWVDWEIRESIRQGKGVIAMHSGDTPPKNLPPAIKEHGIQVRRWNQQGITDAVDEAAKTREPQ